jgi:nucleoside phosphorylase
MGDFSVVLVRTEMGTTRAATTGARLCSSFPGLSLVLITGICGGVPSQAKREDLLLGDVVVSKSIAQHGFGKQYPDVFEAKDTYNYTPGNLQKHVRNAINTFETTAATTELEKRAAIYLEKIQASGTAGPRRERYQYPRANQDQLFRPTYRHKHHVSGQCKLCARCSTTSDPVCDESRTSFCHQLKCSDEYLERRERLEKNKQLESQGHAKQAQKPKVFFGCVASGNAVFKCGEKRDKLAKKLSDRSGDPVLGFEMEGAGVWDELPCLVVKGVCDYADSHKNKLWQDFAAATAAAVTRAIIEQWPKTGRQNLAAVTRTGMLQAPAFLAVYYIPYPKNDEVIQRPDLVAQLEDSLSAVETSQNAALCGLGGSG